MEFYSDITRVLVFGVIWGVTYCAEGDTEGTKCLKDEKFGEYDVNVYYCKDPEKPECCEQDQQFTCCEPASELQSREQLQLWGLLGLVVVVVGFILVCYRKDTYLCEGSTLKERCENCCRCKSAKVDDADKDLSDVSEQMEADDEYYEPSEYSKHRDNTILTARGIDTKVSTSEYDIDSGRGSAYSDGK